MLILCRKLYKYYIISFLYNVSLDKILLLHNFLVFSSHGFLIIFQLMLKSLDLVFELQFQILFTVLELSLQVKSPYFLYFQLVFILFYFCGQVLAFVLGVLMEGKTSIITQLGGSLGMLLPSFGSCKANIYRVYLINLNFRKRNFRLLFQLGFQPDKLSLQFFYPSIESQLLTLLATELYKEFSITIVKIFIRCFQFFDSLQQLFVTAHDITILVQLIGILFLEIGMCFAAGEKLSRREFVMILFGVQGVDAGILANLVQLLPRLPTHGGFGRRQIMPGLFFLQSGYADGLALCDLHTLIRIFNNINYSFYLLLHHCTHV